MDYTLLKSLNEKNKFSKNKYYFKSKCKSMYLFNSKDPTIYGQIYAINDIYNLLVNDDIYISNLSYISRNNIIKRYHINSYCWDEINIIIKRKSIVLKKLVIKRMDNLRYNVEKNILLGGTILFSIDNSVYVIGNKSNNTIYVLSDKILYVNDETHLRFDYTVLESIYIDNIYFSDIKDMSKMFYNNNTLRLLYIKNIDTSNVEDMSNMFSYCNSLNKVNFEDFNTSNVKYFDYMFRMCESFKTLNLNCFDVSNAVSMFGMFVNCSNLKELDINTWNTKIKDMELEIALKMFEGCISLKNINGKKFLDNIKNTRLTTYVSDCPYFYNERI